MRVIASLMIHKIHKPETDSRDRCNTAPHMTSPLSPTLRENLRALPAAAWILFAGTFINRFGTFVMPFLILYFTRKGYSEVRSGLAVGAYGAGHLVASILGGHLADRFGRRNTIALSMFSVAASMMMLSQADSYPAIVSLTFLTGLTGELYRPASSALLADLVLPHQRVAAYSMYRLAINLGFAAGPATAGFLADRSFFLLFAGDAITSALFGLVALFFLPHGFKPESKPIGATSSISIILRDRAFALFLIATLCITLVDFQTASTFALHVRDLGFSNSTYGLLLSLNGMLIVVFELAITAWTQRLPPRPVIAAGYLLLGIGIALTGVAHSVWALAITVVIWTLGEMVSSPVASAYVAGLAPEELRGRYMGAWGLMWSLGLTLGPSLGTIVYGKYPPLVWIGCAVLGTASAIFVLRDPKQIQR